MWLWVSLSFSLLTDVGFGIGNIRVAIVVLVSGPRGTSLRKQANCYRKDPSNELWHHPGVTSSSSTQASSSRHARASAAPQHARCHPPPSIPNGWALEEVCPSTTKLRFYWTELMELHITKAALSPPPPGYFINTQFWEPGILRAPCFRDPSNHQLFSMSSVTDECYRQTSYLEPDARRRGL